MWMAVPENKREPATQQELAKKIEVSQDVLVDWKARPEFWEEVSRQRKHWAKDRTPLVIVGLLNKAMQGEEWAIKMWREWIEGEDLKTPENLLPSGFESNEMYLNFFAKLKPRVQEEARKVAEKVVEENEPEELPSPPSDGGGEEH